MGTPHYTYVVVRQDLTRAQALVQVAHAAYEASRRFDPGGVATHMVAVTVRNQEDLVKMSERLTFLGIDHHVFFEPDGDMGESALATRPIISKIERHAFRKLPMYS